MTFVIGVDGLEGRQDVVEAVEGEEPFAGREELSERGVLGDHRTPRGEIASAAIAEPAASETHVLVLGDGEFSARSQNVVAVGLDASRERHGVDEPPPVRRQQADRFGVIVTPPYPRGLAFPLLTFQGEGQLQRLPAPPREIDELEEFMVFAPRVRLAPPLDVLTGLTPIRNGGEAGRRRGMSHVSRRRGGGPPIEHDRLTRGAVVEAIDRDATIWRAEVLSVREMMGMGVQQVDVGRRPFRHFDLRQDRVRLEINAHWNALMLGAQDRRPGEIDEGVGSVEEPPNLGG